MAALAMVDVLFFGVCIPRGYSWRANSPPFAETMYRSFPGKQMVCAALLQERYSCPSPMIHFRRIGQDMKQARGGSCRGIAVDHCLVWARQE